MFIYSLWTIDHLMSILLVRLSIFLLIVHSVAGMAETKPVSPEKPLYIGVEPRNSPYISNHSGEVFEGVLIDKVLELCQKMKRNCIFSPGNTEELLDALRYSRLEAVILTDQFVSESQIAGLFFFPPFCVTRPVLVWNEGVSSAIDKMNFKHQSIGVLKNSYLELYLQDNFPLNINILPYNLMENAMFDLFIRKIDIVFSSMAFFQDRAKGVFLDNIYYKLPAVAVPLKDSVQSERAMALAIRNNNTVLKKQILSATQKKTTYCADSLPYQSRSLDSAGS